MSDHFGTLCIKGLILFEQPDSDLDSLWHKMDERDSLLLSQTFSLSKTKTESDDLVVLLNNGRSSRPEVFCKKGVLRNFKKLTGKHLCQSLFCNDSACNFIKKETLAQMFSCEFCEISKNTSFYTSGGCFSND